MIYESIDIENSHILGDRSVVGKENEKLFLRVDLKAVMAVFRCDFPLFIWHF